MWSQRSSRGATFVAAVKALYLGETPRALTLPDGQKVDDPRGVAAAVIEFELTEHFGGWFEMMYAPRDAVERARLVLEGKNAARAKQEEDTNDAITAASSS